MIVYPTDLTVLTSAVGPFDPLRDDQSPGGEIFLAYVDGVRTSKVWTLRPAYSRFNSVRRNSRAPKILSHLFCSSEYSLWMDARVALRMPAFQLMQSILVDVDMAVYCHPKRNCLYDEGVECVNRQLDDPIQIKQQLNDYRERKIPPLLGLGECSIIFRRHTEPVKHFNLIWWGEHCRYSVRDQISFPAAVRESNVKLKWLPFDSRDAFFDIAPRMARREPHTL